MREKHTAMVDVLRQLPSPFFTSADAGKLIAHDNVFLNRASRKGYVKKITNSIYWNVLFNQKPPSVEEVACFARRPSYISCEWALNYHGILIQTPTVCTAITLHPGIGKRNRIRYHGFVIEYSKIMERLYLPGEVMRQDGFLMATPEKAFLDFIYLRKKILFGDELEIDLLNQKKLNDLVTIYPERVRKAIRNQDFWGFSGTE